MFLIPKKNLKNFNADRCCIVLNEFAAAEFSSAIEMMYAAKNINNTKLSYGFIKHALDEYNHSFIFNNIKKKIISKYKISKNQLSFIPMQLYHKGYLKKDSYIFEKKKLKDFAVFIGTNELIAEKKLLNLIKHFKENEINDFIEIEKILNDEKKHSEYSLIYANRENGKVILKIKIIKEKIFNLFRHLYADSLSKISFIFNPILILILIIMNFIVNFLELKTESTNEDILKTIDPHSLT
jgi:hypothetical protein